MSERRSLAGQRALVTGASSGIGTAVAKAMATVGAKVVINYHSGKDKADQVVSEIKDAGGEAIAIQADVSHENEVQAMFRQMFDAWGSIDILVNSAGMQKDKAFLEMTLQEWDRVIAVNLTGHFLCAREAAREFVRRGPVPELSKAAGKILFISSVHDLIPWAGHANYTASKAGVSMLMKSIAQELAPQKIRVNAISPGAIRTPINKKAWETPEALAELTKLIPYGRIGEPADIGEVAAWLASDAADYVSGAILYVDGGMTLCPGFREGG